MPVQSRVHKYKPEEIKLEDLAARALVNSWFEALPMAA